MSFHFLDHSIRLRDTFITAWSHAKIWTVAIKGADVRTVVKLIYQ
jgi:hypothetical protein